MAASRLVGTPVPRKEDRRLLLGQARFVADIALPRMLHMAVVRSDHAHALIKGIDITAAASAAGVRLVLTGADLSDSVGPLPSIDLAGEGNAALQRVLATDRVRFVGEPVAVVVAEDPFMAADAAALIEIAYQPLPVVLGAEAAASATPRALL